MDVQKQQIVAQWQGKSFFFSQGTTFDMAKYLHPPFHFLPTIERMSIYLQKVCYKRSLSIKYSYFAFSSINIRSEYGMYHFHGTFLFIYQMVFELACARHFLVQTFGKQPFSAPKHWFINIKWYLWWHFYIVTS